MRFRSVMAALMESAATCLDTAAVDCVGNRVTSKPRSRSAEEDKEIINSHFSYIIAERHTLITHI